MRRERDKVKRWLVSLWAASPEDELACQVDLDNRGVCLMDSHGRHVEIPRNGSRVEFVHYDEEPNFPSDE